MVWKTLLSHQFCTKMYQVHKYFEHYCLLDKTNYIICNRTIGNAVEPLVKLSKGCGLKNSAIASITMIAQQCTTSTNALNFTVLIFLKSVFQHNEIMMMLVVLVVVVVTMTMMTMMTTVKMKGQCSKQIEVLMCSGRRWLWWVWWWGWWWWWWCWQCSK